MENAEVMGKRRRRKREKRSMSRADSSNLLPYVQVVKMTMVEERKGEERKGKEGKERKEREGRKGGRQLEPTDDEE